MQGSEAGINEQQPAWREVANSPLVAMVIALAAILAPAGMVAGLIERAFGDSATAILVGKLVVTLTVIASYKLIARRLGRRKHDDLSGPAALSQFTKGILLGALLFALIVGIAALFDVYNIRGSGDAAWLFTGLVADGIAPAVAEEVLFRAILFRWIEEFAGSWAALILSSLLFGLSHLQNPNADWISTVGIMLEGGVLLGGAYMLTRRLWTPMGIHGAWNFTQGPIFGVPVSGLESHGLLKASLSGPTFLSGGEFGLEASIIAIPIGLIAGSVFIALAMKRGQLVRPSWKRASITNSR